MLKLEKKFRDKSAKIGIAGLGYVGLPLAVAFSYAGLDWQEYVEIDPRYFRPTEAESLLADSSKARKELGWEPKITFSELVRIMVDADMEAAGLEPPGEGKKILADKSPVWHQWESSVSQVIKSKRRGFD